MSDSITSFRRKISSAKNLQSVVRSMKALAASNIRQYEESVRALSDYYHTVELGLSLCLRTSNPSTLTLKNDTQFGTIAAIVFGSDQGLVGQFNDLIVDHTVKRLAGSSTKLNVWAVGERVHEALISAGIPVAGLFPVPNSVKAITPLIEQILIESETKHSWNEITELQLLFNHSVSGDNIYKSTHQQLLPLNEGWRDKLAKLQWPSDKVPEIIGNKTSTLEILIREYLFISLFRACAFSIASENASRLAAMQRADKNIDELLEELNGTYNRLRQSNIDEELFDVISGFETLNNK